MQPHDQTEIGTSPAPGQAALAQSNSDRLLLTAEEVSAVTGYVKPALQVRELHKQGFIRARVNVRNEVILERAYFDAICRGVAVATQAAPERPRIVPPLRRAA
ncbi:hypothetical protein [Scleromatobacter humisilvae]|uniref:DUF4224 domain-containing protein n=1 Tax=Scleromatobacter humisilvae TaxID=2897159 RepID=A0A9X1YK25_9BURK|nr:hypothetical protein [Scleromatobacter humisilvae]MCK9687356.1 DUF4224 domain-containing protein [Scleromatobacter humisilvae]